MMQWVLKINGKYVPWKSLRRMRPDELSSDVEIENRAAFDAQIKINHGNSFKSPCKRSYNESSGYVGWGRPSHTYPWGWYNGWKRDTTFYKLNRWHIDQWESCCSSWESENLEKEIRRSLDKNWQVIGNHSEDSILNTCIYDIEFQDGIIKPYAANVIAQNILSQVDYEFYHSQLLEIISEYSKDECAVDKGFQPGSNIRQWPIQP